MKIVDQNNLEITAPDLTKGKLVPDKLFVKHHDAVPAVTEQSHYETVAEYPNGGKDVRKVIDIPAQDVIDAWDEYEDVLRYVEYTVEELEKINQPTADDDRDSMLVNLEMRLTMLELGIQTNEVK